ncbi:5-dehydro-4-deoxy-D-glucuronate isomerase [Fretibacter rubidus]|uniref:5-dehydro-4-deoxy-D-glucuronate isomerase n=1 Tax=Fretibacter rubidus TaxID=570162 RepID=UPI003529DD39
MEIRYSADIVRYKTMTNSELRDTFVVSTLWTADEVPLVYSDIDRGVVGSAVPVTKTLTVPTHKDLASDYFAQRREVGVINIGGHGSIKVDGVDYDMENLDSLYIGRESKGIEFSSHDGKNPAKFYFVSYPAHVRYETQHIKKSQANQLHLGANETSNKRTIFQPIHPAILKTCQIVMGFTILDSGNVWNTFPPHTHKRRSEYYMYFDLPEDQRVFHFMGEADNMRPMIMKAGEVALSPIWSMHCGAGTSSYTFIWSMGGENQVFDDMDHISQDDIG